MTLKQKRTDTLAAVVAIPGAVAVVTTIPLGVVAFVVALVLGSLYLVLTG